MPQPTINPWSSIMIAAHRNKPISQPRPIPQHTPGPWTAVRPSERSQEWEINAPKGCPHLGYTAWNGLAVVYGSDDEKRLGQDVAEANARLIAAAPAMHEALIQVRRYLGGVNGADAFDALSLVNQALKLAEGDE